MLAKTRRTENSQLLDNQSTALALNIGAGALLAASVIFALSSLARGRKFKSSQDFLQKACVSGAFEIESSRLVLDHSENEDVRQFAETMIDDHMRIDDESNTALSKAGINDVKIKEELDSTHQKMFDKLNKALDNKFDNVYIEAQKKAHAEAVKLFSDYAKSGDNPVLKDFAARVLPTLKHHQEMAQNLTIH
jgi:putative membrane protein